MSRDVLTPVQRYVIGGSPAVSKVTDRKIYLSMPFKAHLLACVSRGGSPSAVFRAAGLDPKVIGYKRIERATAHVRGSRPVRDWLERNGDVWDETPRPRFDGIVTDDVTARDGGDSGVDEVYRILMAVSNRCNELQRRVEILSARLEAVERGSGDVS